MQQEIKKKTNLLELSTQQKQQRKDKVREFKIIISINNDEMTKGNFFIERNVKRQVRQ
jgi:hypothetical protein